jgi:hypothetical protein
LSSGIVENSDEIGAFCHSRNILIHKEKEINEKATEYIIEHICKRMIKEDISSF